MQLSNWILGNNPQTPGWHWLITETKGKREVYPVPIPISLSDEDPPKILSRTIAYMPIEKPDLESFEKERVNKINEVLDKIEEKADKDIASRKGD